MHAQSLELPTDRQIGSFSQKFLDEAWQHYQTLQASQSTIRPLAKSEVTIRQEIARAEESLSPAAEVAWSRLARVLILCETPLGSKLDRLRTKYRDVAFELRPFWSTGAGLPATRYLGDVRALVYVGEHGIHSARVPEYVSEDLKQARIPWVNVAGVSEIDAVLALSQKAPYTWE